MSAGKNSIAGQWLVAGLFAVATLALLYGFVRLAEPAERIPRREFKQDYDEKPLADLLAEQGFEKRMREIAALGTAPGERVEGRLSGSPGFYRTEQLILASYRAAGLDVVTQELPVVVPVTEYCEILDDQGRPLEDVKIVPVIPSDILPQALPAEGLKGELVEIENTSPALLTGKNVEQSIVLTTLSAGNDWVDWKTLASVGVRAVLVKEESPDIQKAMSTDPDASLAWDGLSAKHSMLFWPQQVTFPRFLVRGPIERYAGKAISLRCKVAWQTKYVRNLIGVLRSERPRDEALVVSCYYDSSSAVPDLAPGAEQSISLAALLEYVRALAPYREKMERDVVFVAIGGHAQATAGEYRFLEAIETFSGGRADHQSFEARKTAEQQQLDHATRALAMFERIGTNGAAVAGLRLEDESESFRDWLKDRIKTVSGEICLMRKEASLQAKLAHLRAGGPAFRDGFDSKNATDEERKDPANRHPLLKAYLDAKVLENRAANMMTLPLKQLAGRVEYADWDYPGRLIAYLKEIEVHHRQAIRELEDRIAVRDLFKRYQRTLTVALDLYSGGHRKKSDLAVAVGMGNVGAVVEPQVTELANSILEKVPKAGNKPAFKVQNWGGLDSAGSRECPLPEGNKSPISRLWYCCGHLAFTVFNREFETDKARVFTPEDTLENLRQTDVLKLHIPTLGKALLSMAFGRVTFKPLTEAASRGQVFSLHGTVLANVGSSEMVPSHRMGGSRTFVSRGKSQPGRGIWPLVLGVNPYGEYDSAIAVGLSTFSINAARFGEDGCVQFIKDDSPAQQAIFKNIDLDPLVAYAAGSQAPKPVNLSLFRCAPVTLFLQGNPTTMKDFQQVGFMGVQGLSAPPSWHQDGAVAHTIFLPPETLFYVTLKDGAAANPEVQTVRAFLLNTDPNEAIGANEPELYGKGYLAADTPILKHPHMDTAASMLRTAEKRLAVQRRFGMADKQMLDFHERGREWLDDARTKREKNDPGGALISAATSLAYAINNHPVIRSRITHAVVGILWYLALLVPFVFFCEKLLFGFPDIRKQLTAIGIIFLVVFTLLRIFHPAFEMVRSSLMILLGFIMLLLTLLVSLMVGGKFKQNIKALRAREGKVEGADINRGGVVGTAFMLGLNNMRRRKVRTGLTCLTLVLITFVMICFTSVSTDLVSVEYPTGRSGWNGITVRDANFVEITEDEYATIQRLYSGRYPVTSHQWLLPNMGVWEGRTDHIKNIDIAVDYKLEVAGLATEKRAHLSSVIQMEWNEPQFSGIDKLLLTSRGWFERAPGSRKEKLEAVRRGAKRSKEIILPDTAAQQLGITVEDVNGGKATVSINKAEYVVRGIIDSVAWNRVQGLDGASVLPFDLNNVQALGIQRRATERNKFRAVVPVDVARLPASEVAIVNEMPGGVDRAVPSRISCSVLFPSAPYRLSPSEPERPAIDYREQRRVVMEYLERTGKPAYYALDGVAYSGSRQRSRSLGGMIELLVPIIIAALAVFNTMRGSVYERRSEIYVYNAVGIAPNHVFFMFMAEALVYAVMGAMLGYLLSQATGRMLTMLGVTGGLNMDYSSIETIYASLAIMGAVLLSTLLPARDAARMAAPSKLASWAVPRVEGDEMSLNLPFTFTAHDRIAVISYFSRWLDANGAGSSGPFFCSAPEPHARAAESQPADDRLIPGVVSRVWLKPYDLGVSHRMEISLPTDPETGEYIANIKLVRMSGHAVAWRRVVKPFLGILRKQFLSWRATGDVERSEMFAEAKGLLQKAMEAGATVSDRQRDDED